VYPLFLVLLLPKAESRLPIADNQFSFAIGSSTRRLSEERFAQFSLRRIG